ncbi:Protein of unknown function [Micromonospora lupini str. Lupac 08]|uniref:Uncharacterized protein n=1 Tax=Micromonospora lupini str. Lupac 08 TaxID=1150864 RepID=I0L776_9ACTN|nr:Protein of unknown function [Micromonospora lupini str. Lupac 08]
MVTPGLSLDMGETSEERFQQFRPVARRRSRRDGEAAATVMAPRAGRAAVSDSDRIRSVGTSSPPARWPW